MGGQTQWPSTCVGRLRRRGDFIARATIEVGASSKTCLVREGRSMTSAPTPTEGADALSGHVPGQQRQGTHLGQASPSRSRTAVAVHGSPALLREQFVETLLGSNLEAPTQIRAIKQPAVGSDGLDRSEENHCRLTWANVFLLAAGRGGPRRPTPDRGFASACHLGRRGPGRDVRRRHSRRHRGGKRAGLTGLLVCEPGTPIPQTRTGTWRPKRSWTRSPTCRAVGPPRVTAELSRSHPAR